MVLWFPDIHVLNQLVTTHEFFWTILPVYTCFATAQVHSLLGPQHRDFWSKSVPNTLSWPICVNFFHRPAQLVLFRTRKWKWKLQYEQKDLQGSMQQQMQLFLSVSNEGNYMLSCHMWKLMQLVWVPKMISEYIACSSLVRVLCPWVMTAGWGPGNFSSGVQALTPGLWRALECSCFMWVGRNSHFQMFKTWKWCLKPQWCFLSWGCVPWESSVCR